MTLIVRGLGSRLVEHDDFVGLAGAVCAALAELCGVPRSALALHRTGGGPFLLVDNLGAEQDAYRLATVASHRFRGGPLERALEGEPADQERFAARVTALGFVGDWGHAAVVPLLDPRGVIGSIQCSRPQPLPDALRRHLEVLAGQVSARLAQLRVGAHDLAAPRLTPRQDQIARLAARGASNAEIALELAISANTVKKVLKAVFERLALHNRTELANELPRIAARLDAPHGVVRHGGVWITRGD